MRQRLYLPGPRQHDPASIQVSVLLTPVALAKDIRRMLVVKAVIHYDDGRWATQC